MCAERKAHVLEKLSEKLALFITVQGIIRFITSPASLACSSCSRCRRVAITYGITYGITYELDGEKAGDSVAPRGHNSCNGGSVSFVLGFLVGLQLC